MNRTLCIILSLLLALSVFTACADTNTPASGDTLATGDSVVSEDTLPNEPEITTTKTYDISRYEKSSEFMAVIYNDVPYYYSENIYDPQELAYYLSQAEYVGQVESDADENYVPAEDYSDGETPVGEMFPTKNFQSNFLAIGAKLHILDGYMIAEFAEPWDNGRIVYGQVLMLSETAEEPIIEAEDDEPLTPPTNTVYDGYPSLDDENYSETFDKWYNDKCEIVAAALDEVAFIYGKIIELNESDNGYVKIMIRPNDDNPPNYRDNAYFYVSESTLIRSGYWPGATEITADSLMVGQKVCVAVCHVPDIPEVSPTALYAFAVILLDGDPTNPDSLTDEDFKYVDTDEGIIVEEAEIEVEVEVEEGILVEDPVESLESLVNFEIVNGSLTANGAEFKMLNGNEKPITTGNSYVIEIFKDGEWHYIDIGIVTFPAEAIVLESGQSYDFHIDWTNYYGELVPGKYRLIKEYSVEGSSEIYYAICEFMIRE